MKTNRVFSCLGIMALLVVAVMPFACGGSEPQRLFVADAFNNRVLVYYAPITTGQSAAVVLGQTGFTTAAAATTATSLSISQRVALDRSGNLYVSDAGNCRVLQFQPPFTTGMAATLAIGQTSGATNLTTGTCLTGVSATATNLDNPNGVAVDSAGNLWVVDFFNHRVLKYPAPITAGEAATVALGQTSTGASLSCNQGNAAPTATTLCFPMDLAFDSTGNLWVADYFNNRVLKYPPANLVTGGAATVELGHPAGLAAFITQAAGVTSTTSLNEPAGLAFDSAGNLWIVDANNSRVLMYPPANLVTGGAAILELGQPAGVTAFTSNTPDNGGLGRSTLATPIAVAFDSSGRVFVADVSNNRTLGFAPPFSNGMNATLVLGQANFTTGTSNTGGEGAATQGAPEGIAVAF